MKKALLILFVVLLIAVYLAGYWPQHAAIQQLNASVSQLQEQLNGAQAATRICHIENEMLTLIDQTQAQNYGEAQTTAGQVFNDLRAEKDRAPNVPYAQALQTIVNRRDSIIAGLARADASTLAPVRQSLNELRPIADQVTAQLAR
jgi:hypothetical protein